MFNRMVQIDDNTFLAKRNAVNKKHIVTLTDQQREMLTKIVKNLDVALASEQACRTGDRPLSLARDSSKYAKNMA